jgi:hypothetical protein
MRNRRVIKSKIIQITLSILIFISFFIYNKLDLNKNAGSIQNIDKTQVSQREVRDRLISLLDIKDTNSIFKVIDTIQEDSDLSHNCHEIAHDIGHKAYEYYGFLESMTFNNPNHVKHALPQYICAGGYMHGILEQLSLHKPDFVKQPEIICNSLPESDRDSCYHGIGHVFMLKNNRNTIQSITDCRIIKNNMYKYRCFEGVRMEEFWGNTEDVEQLSLDWDKQKPFNTCINAKEDEKPTCFLYSPFGYLRFNPKDYSGAAQQCSMDSLSKTDQYFCLKGLGMTMMSKFKGKNLEESEIYVDKLSVEQKHAFYQGLINYSRLSGISEENLKKACGLLKNDGVVCIDAMEMDR